MHCLAGFRPTGFHPMAPPPPAAPSPRQRPLGQLAVGARECPQLQQRILDPEIIMDMAAAEEWLHVKHQGMAHEKRKGWYIKAWLGRHVSSLDEDL